MIVGKKIETPYEELTYQIIGCAMAVHRAHGPGLREDTSQRGLEAQLDEKCLDFEAQRLYEVRDSGQGETLIGYYIPDFVGAEQVIVEIKALQGLDNSACAGDRIPGGERLSSWAVDQLRQAQLGVDRNLPPKDVSKHQENRQWLWVPDWLREE